jgi:hypothetical protein
MRDQFFPTRNRAFFWSYAFLCVLVFGVGFNRGKARQRLTFLDRMGIARNVQFNERRLRSVAIFMALVGFIAFSAASRIANEQGLGSQWTGPATFVFMFGQMLNWAFALSVLLVFKNSTRLNVLVCILIFGLVILQMSGYIKRNAVFEIFIIFVGAGVLVRGWKPPLALVLVACVGGTILIHEVSAIRGYAKDNGVNMFTAVFSGAAVRSFREDDAVSTTEMQQAIFDVSRTHSSLQLDWGATYWNKLVHRWVSGFRGRS